MNPEIKTKWLDALRSGKYTQGRGRLKSVSPGGATAHCCLGVLCEIAAAEGITIETDHGTFDNEDSYLPASVQQWAGVDRGPMVKNDSGDVGFREVMLDRLNDSGVGFDRIADLIETSL